MSLLLILYSKRKTQTFKETALTFVQQKKQYVIKVAFVFLAGLFLLCCGVTNTTDASNVLSTDWKKQYAEMMHTTNLLPAIQSFLNAYQNQDQTKMEPFADSDILSEFVVNQQTKQLFISKLEEVFGSKQILTKKMKKAITQFADKLCADQVMSYTINNWHIRDSVGQIETTLVLRPSPTVIFNYNIAEVVTQEIDKYSDKHRKELLSLYEETSKDTTAVTKKVMSEIYQPILTKFREMYLQEKTTQQNVILTANMNDEHQCVVTDIRLDSK